VLVCWRPVGTTTVQLNIMNLKLSLYLEHYLLPYINYAAYAMLSIVVGKDRVLSWGHLEIHVRDTAP